MVVTADEVRIKRRTPGEVTAYHDGFRAGMREAIRRMRKSADDIEVFAQQAYALQRQVEGAEATIPYPLPDQGGGT